MSACSPGSGSRRPLLRIIVAGLAMMAASCGQDVTEIPEAASPTSSQEPPSSVVSTTAGSSDNTSGGAAQAIDEAADRFDSVVGRDYVVTFEFVSSATAEAGPIRVVVEDNLAVDVTYPDETVEQILPSIPMLTVGDFFSRARAVLNEGGLVEATFDESYGHPLTMTLDPIPNAIDDEMSIVLRSVEPADSSVEADGY